ncbi:MAG: hypothetical protein RMJ59_01590 [Candidatus Nitrosocaldus sp.]|nr:hypothetical protein [Candidatus Nitrosocaldus sp.]MDW8275058.1 hypothetical protein [Candidatus Nitrosocaldus sp.]
MVIPAHAQRERVGMSDDIDFMIVGIDGYYTDGSEQYYRIGDRLVVRGSVSGSSSDASIKVIAPDGSIWYSQSVKLGYVNGLSYYITDHGVESREWSSENGFYMVAGQFRADDLEGKYRLVIDSGVSGVERVLVFKKVEGSYGDTGQGQSSGTGLWLQVVGTVTVIAVSTLVFLTIRRRRIQNRIFNHNSTM